MDLVRKKYTIGLFLAVIILGGLAFVPWDLTYSVRTRAVVKAKVEWEIFRNSEGSISSLLRNNLTGSISSYGNTEFRRGDVMKFEMLPGLYEGGYVEKGDTIGYLYSNDEQMRLIEMKGELKVLESQLKYYTAGQKPEDVVKAEREVDLANQELETQRKLMKRTEMLMKDSVISVQQYEMDLNELKVKALRKTLAEAALNSIKAGDKPEQIELIHSRISALRQQIKQVENRLEYMTLISPLPGMIVLERNFDNQDMLLKVIDTSNYIGVAPLLLQDREYITEGSEVHIITQLYEKTPCGFIKDFNNVSEIVDGQGVVFFTIQFDKSLPILFPGNFIEIEVKGVGLRPIQYMAKSFNSPG